MMPTEIIPSPPDLDAETLAALRSHASSTLADSTPEPIAMGGLRPMHRSGKLFGLALTVRTTPGDNLLVQKAVDLARPGEVIVIDGGGFAARALVGGDICRRATRRGVGGFVVDGAIRDLDVISTSDLPVYARYVTPRGPTREGHGAINVPLQIDGVAVQPGDVMLGDLDGLVCVPRGAAAALIPKARHLAAEDEARLAQV